MPTIEYNKSLWDGDYNWQNRGDEWSAAWGGPFMQWYGTLFPRIRAHVPADNILEIACGYGRWTQYLKDLCKNLTVIDLSDECINACKQRFSTSHHIEYHVNDGRSLDMIPDRSIDFVFSFDSLVHANDLVIETYLSQLPRILNKDGIAFIHHSNLGLYQNKYLGIRRIPKLEGFLKVIGVLDKQLHLRDFSMDAKKFEALAENHGLRCVSQEMVLWGTKKTFIDCISTITRNDSPTVVPNRVLKNAYFMQEARNLLQLSGLYSPEKAS
jgi:SAM-dependent methyltransferase